MELPPDWVAVSQPTNFLVQKRARMLDGEQSVSMGVLLAPGLSAREFAALGLVGLRKIDQGAASLAKELGVSMGQLEKMWIAVAGRKTWDQIAEQNKLTAVRPREVTRTAINAREAYVVCGDVVYEGRSFTTKQWIIEGFSPGEMMFVTAAATSTNALAAIPLPAGIEVSDTRTDESRFPGFRLKLPKGTTSTQFTHSGERMTGVFKFPAGLWGRGVVQVTATESEDRPSQALAAARSLIKSMTKKYKELDSNLDEQRGILFGKLEMNYELLDSPIGSKTTGETLCVAKKKNGPHGLIFAFYYPPDSAVVIRPMIRGIIDGVSLRSD